MENIHSNHQQKVVNVAVGVIKHNNHYFLTKRAADSHQGGKWEFPGGKIEAGESVFQALHRELKEEVAIEVLSCQPLIDINHDYGDKIVNLHVYIIDNFSGQCTPLEGQQGDWFALTDFDKLTFPAANTAIISALKNSN